MTKAVVSVSKFFVLSFAVLFISESSQASERLFGYLYTAETTPADNWEYEQLQTLRTGKARGKYTSVDVRNEFEYGITNELQGALYINSSYLASDNQYDPEDVSVDLKDRNEYNINGISIELMYRLLSPYKDGIGLAAYLEPEIGIRDEVTGDDAYERAIEARVILQKNFIDDRLVTAANFMVEPEWEKLGPYTLSELFLEFTVGASYRPENNWYFGLEFRNHMEFPDLNLGTQEHSAYFLGPTIHYGSEGYWWTVTALPQIAGWPRKLGKGTDGKEVDGGYAHLAQHEKFELRIAFGIPLKGEHSHHGH